MNYSQETLNNGLNTLFVDAPGNTSATVQIWFRAGSALEKKENQGIAHFLEHMFFKGTPIRPGAQIAHEVESFGGEINAFTSFDYTCYYINAPHTQIDKTIQILMDMVSNPKFENEDLYPERDVVFEEYRRSQDNPGQYGFSRMIKSSFTSGYGHPILGTEKTIKNFTREQLIEFRNEFYNLSNTMLVVAGDLKNKETYVKSIEKFQLPHGEKSIIPKFKLKKSSNLDIYENDIRLSQITLTTQAPNADTNQAVAEDLAYCCLGHGETSKLYSELVLDGSLASSASASTMFMRDGGAHFLRLTFPTENASKIYTKLLKVLNSVIKDGFSKVEIDRIKNQYIASKIYEKESLESFVFSFGHSYASSDNIHADTEFIDKIRKLSVDQINDAIKSILSKFAHISLAVPKKEKTPALIKATTSLRANLLKLNKKLEVKDSSKKIKLQVKGSKNDPNVSVVSLKKGITLIHRHNSMNPTFVLHAYLKGGLIEENANTNGSYSMLAGLLSKGYHKVSFDKLKEDLEDKSADISGFAGKNAYGMTMHGQTEHATELFNHFLGSLLTPTMSSKFLAHDKTLTLRSLEAQKEDPIKHLFSSVNNLMFNKHPYSMNSLGTSKSVKKISKKSLEEIHSKNLKSKEMLFTYCGDLDLETVKNLILDKTKDLKARAIKKSVPLKFTSLHEKETFIPFDREQTHIFTFIPAVKFGHKDNLYLKMLTTHLSGQSSELFVEVRDRQGLCYTAQPIHFTALDGGYFGIYIATGNDKVERAQKAVNDIINKFKTQGLSEEEFDRVKEMMKGQDLINIQTNEDYANIYSVPVLHGRSVDNYYQGNEAINDLTYEDFVKNLKRLLSKKWNTTIVGTKEV